MAVRKYRVREGFRYGPNDQYKAGDIVELEETAARFEMDKLELAEIVHNVPPPAVPVAPPAPPPVLPTLEEELESTLIEEKPKEVPPKPKRSRKSGD